MWSERRISSQAQLCQLKRQLWSRTREPGGSEPLLPPQHRSLLRRASRAERAGPTKQEPFPLLVCRGRRWSRGARRQHTPTREKRAGPCVGPAGRQERSLASPSQSRTAQRWTWEVCGEGNQTDPKPTPPQKLSRWVNDVTRLQDPAGWRKSSSRDWLAASRSWEVIKNLAPGKGPLSALPAPIAQMMSLWFLRVFSVPKTDFFLLLFCFFNHPYLSFSVWFSYSLLFSCRCNKTAQQLPELARRFPFWVASQPPQPLRPSPQCGRPQFGFHPPRRPLHAIIGGHSVSQASPKADEQTARWGCARGTLGSLSAPTRVAQGDPARRSGAASRSPSAALLRCGSHQGAKLWPAEGHQANTR